MFDEVGLEADRQGLLSDEHFTVDGTLIEAAASLKSFRPKDALGLQLLLNRLRAEGQRRRHMAVVVMTPHVAQNNKGRSSAIDGRTTRHPGYALSQGIRKRVEEIFDSQNGHHCGRPEGSVMFWHF